MKQIRHISGGINLDDSVEVMDAQDYAFAKNCLAGLNHEGTGKTTNLRGNTALTDATPIITSGSVWHGTINVKHRGMTFLFFYHATAANNKIIKVEDDGITEIIAGATLGFDSDFLVNGGGLVGDLLYFTDGKNNPRVINITSDWSSYIEEDIALLRRPPIYPPTVARDYDSGFAQNLIRDEDFQFALQYKYIDGQLSVMSPYSLLSRRNSKDDNFNHIDVTFPVDETPPTLVSETRLCMRIGNTGAWQVVDKSASATPDFAFYNNTSGESIGSTYEKPFEVIPKIAKAMEIAHNRLWLGNYTLGYDTPAAPSLSGSIDVDNAGITEDYTVYHVNVNEYLYEGNWYDNGESMVAEQGYFIKGSDNLYYKVQEDGTYGSPTGIIADGITMRYSNGEGYETTAPAGGDAEDKYAPRSHPIYVRAETTQATGVTINVETHMHLSTTDSVVPSLARNSPYQIGLIYADELGVKCGVATDDTMKITTVSAGKSFTLNWTLANHNNIPSWARSFSVVMTKNLRKSWFLEGYSSKVVYTKVDGDGVKTFTNSYDRSYNYIEIDISGLMASKEGYDYAVGDRVILYDINSADQDLEIIGQDGNRIVCGLEDIGTLDVAGSSFRTELYTPVKKSSNLIFYEVGETYPIIDNAGTPNFETLTGSIRGDVVTVIKTKYNYSTYDYTDGSGTLIANGSEMALTIDEILDDDDNFLWNSDVGRPYIVDEIGQVERGNAFRFSNTFLEGTKVNGLSEFEPLAEDSTPVEDGLIQALKITKKAQKDGDVMLAIGELNTSAIYIGETAFSTADGTSFMITSEKIVGQINTMMKGSGTLNPESIFEYNGQLYWYDRVNRAFMRYSTNGIHPISQNKAIKHFEDLSELYQDGDKVVTGYDPYYKLIMTTFERASENTKKTLSFHTLDNRWKTYHDFAPEAYFEIGGVMYSVYDGKVYKHNSSTYNNYYGSQYDLEIEVSFNDNPADKKEFNVFSADVDENLLEWANGDQNVKSGAMTVSFTNRNGQATDLISTDFSVDESVVYGELLNDVNNGGYVDGDEIVSNTLQATLKIVSSVATGFYFLHIGYVPSTGHAL